MIGADRESARQRQATLAGMPARSTTTSTRDVMLDAARDLIAEIGYEAMSHADITAAVGMGRTTFYEHFASKEDMLVELVRRDLPPLMSELLESVDGSLPPDERLRVLGQATVEFVGTDHIGLILHTEVPRMSHGAQCAISEAHVGLAKELGSIFSDGVEAGLFRDMPPRFAGVMIEGILMTGGRMVMDSKNPSEDVHGIAKLSADTLVAALRP